MQPDEIAISEFKAHFLRLADEISRSGRTVTVTRHGRPLVEVRAAAPLRPLEGSVEFLVDIDELIAPIDVAWDAAQ